MKHIKLYEEYNNFSKIYNNLNNNDEGIITQIPFSLWEDEICIYCENIDYNLCFGGNFYYDNKIKDDEIKNALNKDLTITDINKNWEDDMESIFATEKLDIHTLRVAKLVKEIQDNKNINPVSMFFDDRSFGYRIPSYIEDGNHRIRALKYLEYTHFPAFVYGNGSESLIKYLNKL